MPQNKGSLLEMVRSGNFTVTQQWDYFNKDWPELKNEDYMKYCADHGVTSLQSYVYWASVEKKRGIYSFDFYDDIIARMSKYGLKWVPFIIVGPDYATPDWFHGSSECVYAKCLEHGEDSRIQSIWNPNIIKYFDGFIKAVADHFEHDIIESVLIGISGNWGESIYPVGGGFNFKQRPFHTHLGWWCGDDYARADYEGNFDIEMPSRRDLKVQRYISRLLSIAHDRYDNSLVDALDRTYLKYLSKKNRGRHIRRMCDFTDWYISSMNRYLDKCLSITRNKFPHNKIYVVTGGDGNPMIGVDFTQQANIAKKYDSGIRITNQSDDYLESSVLTRWTATAAKHYSSYFTTEEAMFNSYDGIKARLLEAASSGADGVYFKTILDCTLTDNCELKVIGMGEGGHILMDRLNNIKVDTSITNTALLLPTTTVRCVPFYIKQIYRDAIGIIKENGMDFICEDMISRGLLAKYRELVVLSSATVEREVYHKIREWARNGGKITLDNSCRLYDFCSSMRL